MKLRFQVARTNHLRNARQVGFARFLYQDNGRYDRFDALQRNDEFERRVLVRFFHRNQTVFRQ